MRAHLKGINRVRNKRTGRVYYYAWKGGPRLEGEPGSPEFVVSYHKAHEARAMVPRDQLRSVLDAYQRSPAFDQLKPRTRADYIRQIRKIETAFGDFPVAALADRRARGEFMQWRDELAKTSRRQADYALAILALILSWAYDRGTVPANPVERPRKTYKGSRRDAIWTPSDEAAFLAVAPPRVALGFMLALWTGQRQGDCIAMRWAQYDGEVIRLPQGKTDARLVVPVGAPLKAYLDEAPRPADTILATTRGKPWTEDGFRTEFHKAKKAAGIEGLTFSDLRGTAVTRLAVAGCTVPEIAAITGHTLARVESILDAHYLSRDSALAAAAIRKREEHESGLPLPKSRPKLSGPDRDEPGKA